MQARGREWLPIRPCRLPSDPWHAAATGTTFEKDHPFPVPEPHVLVPLILVALAGGGPTPAASSSPALSMPADTLTAIYRAGVSFQDFLGAAEARKVDWEATWAGAGLDGAMVERALQAGKGWRILAVAEDWCSDSVSSVPYIARLVEELPGVELRVVTSGPGAWVMEQYRSPDGRGTTPTVLLLDPSGAEVGCWIEQPSSLQEWWLAPPAPEETNRDRMQRKMAWYAEDAGRQTVQEMVEMLEGAAAGSPVCPAH